MKRKLFLISIPTPHLLKITGAELISDWCIFVTANSNVWQQPAMLLIKLIRANTQLLTSFRLSFIWSKEILLLRQSAADISTHIYSMPISVALKKQMIVCRFLLKSDLSVV